MRRICRFVASKVVDFAVSRPANDFSRVFLSAALHPCDYEDDTKEASALVRAAAGCQTHGARPPLIPDFLSTRIVTSNLLTFSMVSNLVSSKISESIVCPRDTITVNDQVFDFSTVQFEIDCDDDAAGGSSTSLRYWDLHVGTFHTPDQFVVKALKPKHPFENVVVALGTDFDLTYFSSGSIVVGNKEGRVDDIVTNLESWLSQDVVDSIVFFLFPSYLAAFSQIVIWTHSMDRFIFVDCGPVMIRLAVRFWLFPILSVP